MSGLLFEIHGTGIHNRGAELMALAIATRLRQTAPDVRLAVGPKFGAFADRARHGFLLTNGFRRRSFSGLLAAIAPRQFREAVGLVHRAEVTAILDASGFAYGDQWGASWAASLLAEMQRSRRRHQKLVLLPQAFGPFRNREVALVCRRLLAHADLVYARDAASYAAVQELGISKNLRLCPDFTVALPGAASDHLTLPPRLAALVPNVRMLDKTGDREGQAYLRFLEQAVTAFREAGFTPVVVLHDALEDSQLLPSLFARVGVLPVVESRDPLILKGVLGRAQVVLSSRYHALVGALSQGVPCIGAGWAHKYHWLFSDFGCPECLVEDIASPDSFRQILSGICDAGRRAALVERIRTQSRAIKGRVEQMWCEVEECLGLRPPPAAPRTPHESARD